MYSVTPKISWSTTIPGPRPDVGRATNAGIWPPSWVGIISVDSATAPYTSSKTCIVGIEPASGKLDKLDTSAGDRARAPAGCILQVGCAWAPVQERAELGRRRRYVPQCQDESDGGDPEVCSGHRTSPWNTITLNGCASPAGTSTRSIHA